VENFYNYKAFNGKASITEADRKLGIVTGYFSHFNNVDSDGDIIRPGAFKKSIKENGPNSALPRIKHLLNHNSSQPLGVLNSLKEDSTGLLYESQVGTHSLGQDFIKMIESGLITEHSIGFEIVKRNQLQSYEQYIKNPSAGWYEITEVKLYEGSSLTAWGANPLTPLTSLKSMNDLDLDLIAAQQKAIEKFCRNTDATDETIQTLLIHSKQLTQLLLDINKDDTLPGMFPTEPEEDLLTAMREFAMGCNPKPKPKP
jgi:hypothetical protein